MIARLRPKYAGWSKANTRNDFQDTRCTGIDIDSLICSFTSRTRKQDLNELIEYVKVDETRAKKDLKAVDNQIADLQSQLDELHERKAMLERVIAMAAGGIDVGRLSKSKGNRKSTAKGQSIDPQKIVDFLKENGGTATLDELKQALRVGGRVIGGALRKDDRLTKDGDGNYTVNT